MPQKRILVGEIGRPHGVRGLVKLRSFTSDPTAIASYGPLTDEAGVCRIALTLLAEGLAQVDGVTDREGAEKLTGVKLYIPREALPPTEDEDEFYLADLIGLAARVGDAPFGAVRAVEEHGAGAILVLETSAGEVLLPFTKACVPVVDVAAGFVCVVPPGAMAVQGGDAA